VSCARRERVFLATTIIAFIGISWWKGLRQGGRQRLSPVACPDPVHLVLTPTWPTVWLALGKAHRGASAFIKARLGATGHLFLSRFGSVAMDEDHLMAARTVALNPVMARLAERAQDWPWSAARAHLRGPQRRTDSWTERLYSRARPAASPTFSTRRPPGSRFRRSRRVSGAH
jgi:putative transposase